MPEVLAVPGFSAIVKVDGEDAIEYINEDEPPSAPNKAVRYIEAIPGSIFEMQCTIHKTYPHKTFGVTIDYYVDGQRAYGIYSENPKLFGDREHVYTCKGHEKNTSNGCQVFPFEFAKLAKDEDKSIDAKIIKKASNIGTIRLVVQRADRGEYLPTISRDSKSPKSLWSISEKALKGKSISTRTKYGAPQAVAARGTVSCLYHDSQEKPLLEMIWKYRTMDDLMMEHIVARPSESPENDSDSIDTRTPAQLREALRKAEERAAKLELGIAIKSEANGSKRERAITINSDDDDVEVVSFRNTKRVKPEPGMAVLDLTAD